MTTSGREPIGARPARRSGRRRTRLADLGDLLRRGAQVGQPGLGVAAREAHAPCEGVGAGAGDTRVDEGVEHLPVGLSQPGHDGWGERRERPPVIAYLPAPRDGPPRSVRELGGYLDPLLAGLLTERLGATACG